MRMIKPLNFEWKYRPTFEDKDLAMSYSQWNGEVVNIPHTNLQLPYNYFDETSSCFISCYKKEIEILPEYEGKEVYVCFEGAGHYSRVYLGEVLIGEHKGGYTPFEIRIDQYVKIGQTVTLTVELDSTERKDVPPFGNVVDYLGYGGIYREVSLKIVDPIHIKDVFIKTNDVLKQEKNLSIDCELSKVEAGLSLEVEVQTLEGDVLKTIRVNADKQALIVLSNTISGVELWDLKSPTLYQLVCRVKKENVLVDEVVTRFGFREVSFKTDGFYLNGEKIKLHGLNRHQSYAYVGYAMPKSIQEKDAMILKYELGCNVVRTSHYPQSIHFLNKCDEIGLLVFEEIPGWQHVSELPEWREVVMNNVKEMILRDRNHPSIILWGVRINESGDCEKLYVATNQLARELDPTRQTGGVRCFGGSQLLEDVYTFNDFIHRGHNAVLQEPEVISNSKDAPYLVTEYGGHMFPTKRFDNEGKRLDHALIHARIMNEVYRDDRISGAIGWCMNDYNTHEDFGSGDKICYHGIQDMFRIPKLAASVYASMQADIPVLEISSSMNIGEHAGAILGEVYVFTNLDYVKFYRNEQLIGTFYPNREQFKHLAHPPILIDDMIGDNLAPENFASADEVIIKEVLMYGVVNGADFPEDQLEKIGPVLAKYNKPAKYVEALYNKYVGAWGWKSLTYKFEGYKNDELVKTVVKSGVKEKSLAIEVDNHVLIESETYDATRIVCKAICQNKNLLPYANDALLIEVEGPIELIGPNLISLLGGARGFYIKTKGESGVGRITISSESYQTQKIEVEVIKQ
ncbi:MAG TPA: beta-galactosidase [Firmicutes bacterium]|nr:beta-galactosidase [Bacillota bacterium]